MEIKLVVLEYSSCSCTRTCVVIARTEVFYFRKYFRKYFRTFESRVHVHVSCTLQIHVNLSWYLRTYFRYCSCTRTCTELFSKVHVRKYFRTFESTKVRKYSTRRYIATYSTKVRRYEDKYFRKYLHVREGSYLPWRYLRTRRCLAVFVHVHLYNYVYVLYTYESTFVLSYNVRR